MINTIRQLEELRTYVQDKLEQTYSKMGFAKQHNFQMEVQALQYKIDAYTDIKGEILIRLHQLYQEKNQMEKIIDQMEMKK